MSDGTVETWAQVCDAVRTARALLAAERGSEDWLTTSMRSVDLLESLGHALEVQLFASAGRPRDIGGEALKALIAVRRGWEPSPLSAHVAPRRESLRQALSHLEVARLMAVGVAESGPLSPDQIRQVVVPAVDEIAASLADIGKGLRSVSWNRRAVYLERRAADLRGASHKIAKLTRPPEPPPTAPRMERRAQAVVPAECAHTVAAKPRPAASRVPESWRRSARQSPQAW